MCTSQKISKMKKYVITSADGKRRLTQTTYPSREEAGDALMYYIDTNNAGYPKGDDNYLNPFDFTLVEVESEDANELVTDLDSAKKVLDFKLNDGLTLVHGSAGRCAIDAKKAAWLVRSVDNENLKALIVLNKLFILARAWNKVDGFVPNFLDNGQRKYYPYFVRDPGDAKHIIVNVSVTVGCDALCLNRICFKSEKRAMQFGEKFIDLFKQVLLK